MLYAKIFFCKLDTTCSFTHIRSYTIKSFSLSYHTKCLTYMPIMYFTLQCKLRIFAKWIRASQWMWTKKWYENVWSCYHELIVESILWNTFIVSYFQQIKLNSCIIFYLIHLNDKGVMYIWTILDYLFILTWVAKCLPG